MRVELKAKLNHILLIEAVASIIYAVIALVFTRQILSLHGIDLDQEGVFTTQLAASLFFAFAVMNLYARRIHDIAATAMIVVGNFLKYLFCLVVASATYLTGSVQDQRILSLVLLYALFTLVFGFYQFFVVPKAKKMQKEII